MRATCCGLKPLDPLDPEPGPRERGIAIHGALEHFLRAHPDALPDDALARLLQASEEAFAAAGASPAALALWRPRFARAARWFVSYQTTRRKEIVRSITETSGSLELPGPAGPFTLVGRADRIDLFRDGRAAIIDYKTGRVPSQQADRPSDRAAIAARSGDADGGSFRRHPLRRACASSSTSSSRAAIRRAKRLIPKADASAKALEARERLIGLIAEYDDESRGYRSREMPYRMTDKGDYDHLARVAEWSRIADDE